MPGQVGEKHSQFLRVACRIREQIVFNWPLGHRLPGETTLGERYGVSRGTARRALDQLRDEGLIATTAGHWSAVAVKPAVTEVRVGPGDTVTTRLPDPDEQDALRIPQGVPLLSVTRPGAEQPELYNGAVTVVRGA